MFVAEGEIDYYYCKLKDEDKNESHKYEFSQQELKHRQEFCPLQSVDGLIEKIEHKRKYLGNYSESYGLAEAIAIIKEYCGMED